MPRDPYKLNAFLKADDLVPDVYRITRGFPPEERLGLQSQIRRAAVSVTANIVEGASRRTAPDFIHFLYVAMSSASEARYLLRLAGRLELLARAEALKLVERYDEVVRMLHGLIGSLPRTEG